MDNLLATSATRPVLTEPRKDCTPNVRPHSLQACSFRQGVGDVPYKLTGVTVLRGLQAIFV
ncbi:MAG: hypothetical protein Q8M77_00010 [Hydrogenophaga sp.]|nr:hypothetical protein [Hydrogenophaga sp.]